MSKVLELVDAQTKQLGFVARYVSSRHNDVFKYPAHVYLEVIGLNRTQLVILLVRDSRQCVNPIVSPIGKH